MAIRDARNRLEYLSHILWHITLHQVRTIIKPFQIVSTMVLLLSLLLVTHDSGVAQTSVVLNWITPGNDGMSGTPAKYDIRYSYESITEDNWNYATQVSNEPVPVSGGQQDSMTVLGITSDTVLYFAMKVSDEVPNWSPLSENLVVYTHSLVLDIELPQNIQLQQNYPNPFNPSCVIEYSISSPENVNISIYNIVGRHVATVIDEKHVAGDYAVIWNGTDNSGSQVASGIYLYSLTAGNKSTSKKMMLIR